LARDVFVELCEAPTKYQVARGGLPKYAKLRVRTFALDYLKDRKRACVQQRLFKERAHLQLAPADGPCPSETAEQRDLFDKAIDRVRIAILQLPLEQQRVAAAYVEYGPADFASRLAAELGVSANRVSQWWTRAKRALRDAIGPEVDVFE
jgi:RNA polymerase sigma factor (sigma-70 family)